jgi:stress response protein SCP2
MSVDFVINLFEASTKGETFGDLSKGKIRLVNVPAMGDANGDEKIVIDLTADEYYNATGMLAFTLVRNGVSWEVKRQDLVDARWAHTQASADAVNKVEPTK